jgi:cobalamin biosynthesis protein CobT
MVERLRSVFYFRKKKATDIERLLKTGMVDEEELWRVGVGDTRVFERQTQPEQTFTSVTMLVDASGSMVGEGLDKAQELANVMMACLRTQKGVRTRVRAHTTGHDYTAGGSSCKIYRIWEPGDPDTRIGLISAIPHGSNYDGFAIDWCAQELDRDSLPGESKLLLVLSDGLPAGSFIDTATSAPVHYGGQPAMEHMLELSTQWDRRGVHIVQIAIDQDGIRPEDQAQMFKHWIGYESDQKLLMDLTKVLAKTFGAEE